MHPSNTNWQYIYLQSFDQNDNILSSTERIQIPNSAFHNVFRHLYAYNLQNTLICDRYQEFQNDSSTVDHHVDTFMYNANNDLDTLLGLTWGQNANITFGDKLVYTYDNNHNILSQTDLQWDTVAHLWKNVSRSTFSYSNNLLISKLSELWLGSWTNDQRDSYTYNANNLQEKDTKQYWQNNTWNDNSRDSNVYLNGNLVLFFHDEWNTDSSKWLNYSMDSNAYDASSNKIYSGENAWDAGSQSYIIATRTTSSYNNYNQPLEMKVEDSGVSGWTLQYIKRYHYQEYDPAGITKADKFPITLKLFPSPASELITIESKWEKPEPFTVCIYDMSGNIVRRWSENKTVNYHRTFSTSSLAKGNYVISIRSQNVNQQSQFSVVH